MDSTRRHDSGGPAWPMVRAAYERALDMTIHDRREYLAQIERDDAGLADRVRRLFSSASTTRLDPAQPMAFLARELSIPVAPRDGEQIGRFTLVRLVGSGGMGVVYEARDPMLGRTVAIKVIHGALTSSESVRRFEREAHALARLRHPGIAHVHETGWMTPDSRASAPSSPAPYLVLEYIPDARPLDAKGLSFVELIERFLNVLSAVQHAHEHGIIHCDLKPANILIDRSNQPKLIDFGLARLGTQLEKGSNGTAGTLRYMSPERCGTRSKATSSDEHGSTGDTRSDIFALGIILFELLEGRSPYACVNGPLGELLDAVRAGVMTPPTLNMAPRSMRPDLHAILSRALALDPADRFSSVAALAEDLRRLLRHEPITARPPTLVHGLKLMTRRHRVAVGTAAIVIIATCLGVVATAVGLVHARRARVEAEREVVRTTRVIRFLEATINSVSDAPMFQSASAQDDPLNSIDLWLHEGARFAQTPRTGEGARVVDVLLHAADAIHEQFADDPLLEAQLAIDLAQSLRSVGHGEGSVALARRARDLRLAHLGPRHDETLKAIIAVAIYSNGDPAQPDLLRHALNAVEGRFGRTDPRWAELQARIADAVAVRQGPGAAADELTRAITECSHTFGPSSAIVAGLQFQLGMNLAEIPARQDEGMALLHRAHATTMQIEGEGGANTLRQRFQMGLISLEQDAVRAEAIFRDCLQAATRFMSPSAQLCYEVRTRLYEALMRQRKLSEAEAVAREQLEYSRTSTGESSYSTVKSKARVARVMTWRATLGDPTRLEEAEQLSREAAIDGLKFDEKSLAGDYDAYFRAIWAQSLLLFRDAGSLAQADKLISETLDARRGVPEVAWCEGYLYLTLSQLRRAQGRRGDADEALSSADRVLDGSPDHLHPIVLTRDDIKARQQ